MRTGFWFGKESAFLLVLAVGATLLSLSQPLHVTACLFTVQVTVIFTFADPTTGAKVPNRALATRAMLCTKTVLRRTTHVTTSI
jgi:hypothetical protein